MIEEWSSWKKVWFGGLFCIMSSAASFLVVSTSSNYLDGLPWYAWLVFGTIMILWVFIGAFFHANHGAGNTGLN